MRPLVSILIPAFNAEEWIEDTIASAVGQTWPHKEIIIVDDGSTDRTLETARRHASKNVLVIGQENRGGAAARNTAFAHAQGDYIQWLDADDLLSVDKIEKQVRLAAEYADPKALLSSAWAYFMYRPSAARFTRTSLWEDLSPIEWVRRKWSCNLHMQTATWLVSREITEATGPWNPALLVDDDGEYFTRAVLASDAVRFVGGASVYYRVVGPRRVSHIGLSADKMESQLTSMKLQIRYVRAVDDSAATRAAVVSYLQTWASVFYPERPDLFEELRTLAIVVGGQLTTPQVGWKYSLIDVLFGRTAAKSAQLRYNRRKTRFLRTWDKLLASIAGR